MYLQVVIKQYRCMSLMIPVYVPELAILCQLLASLGVIMLGLLLFQECIA